MKITNLSFRIVVLFIALSIVDPLFAKLQSDDFNGSKLSSVWEIDNPKKSKWGVDGGKFSVVGGINANVWQNVDATFFYQETDQKSFDVETTVVVDYAKGSTVTGILILSETTKDSKGRKPEWITLKLWGRGGGDNNAVLQYQRRENDNLKGLVGTQPDYKPPAGIISVSLRVKRDGNTYDTSRWFVIWLFANKTFETIIFSPLILQHSIIITTTTAPKFKSDPLWFAASLILGCL
jgi:hypothetical protein